MGTWDGLQEDRYGLQDEVYHAPTLIPALLSAAIKEVSRFNILFYDEDEADLSALVAATIRHKVRHQGDTRGTPGGIPETRSI